MLSKPFLVWSFRIILAALLITSSSGEDAFPRLG